ncbi:hypothetical protein T459_27907 [Capsicum annuum]|uniref:RRM domain-containing protein n=1 Tax=Capsicum annuum TaxID=4072 RepID=A0A2G2YFC0_CAPAN|nr:hypothetical protein T459_27907 [Capsicum annuum]
MLLFSRFRGPDDKPDSINYTIVGASFKLAAVLSRYPFQVGLVEIKVASEKTSGLVVLAESFGHSVFKDSLSFPVRWSRVRAVEATTNACLRENPSEKDINQGTLVCSTWIHRYPMKIFDKSLEHMGKSMREIPHKHHYKFIKFYDVREVDAALKGLNHSDIAGKRIRLEPSRLGGAHQKCIVLSSRPYYALLLDPTCTCSRKWKGSTTLGFNVHSLGEALDNQPINCPSVGSNNQGVQNEERDEENDEDIDLEKIFGLWINALISIVLC